MSWREDVPRDLGRIGHLVLRHHDRMSRQPVRSDRNQVLAPLAYLSQTVLSIERLEDRTPRHDVDGPGPPGRTGPDADRVRAWRDYVTFSLQVDLLYGYSLRSGAE